MRKRFNVNGACIPDIHYMVKIDERLKDIEVLIDAGEYFTINRARQYGRTTTLMCLEKYLSEKYIVLSMSFEGVDRDVFAGETEFCGYFLKLLYTSMDYGTKEGIAPPVILSGVYDIKNLKLKIRKDETHQYNSPWNIAADFWLSLSGIPYL